MSTTDPLKLFREKFKQENPDRCPRREDIERDLLPGRKHIHRLSRVDKADWDEAIGSMDTAENDILCCSLATMRTVYTFDRTDDQAIDPGLLGEGIALWDLRWLRVEDLAEGEIYLVKAD